jgi:hypothetical protein
MLGSVMQLGPCSWPTRTTFSGTDALAKRIMSDSSPADICFCALTKGKSGCAPLIIYFFVLNLSARKTFSLSPHFSCLFFSATHVKKHTMSLSAELQAKLQKQVEFYFSDVNIAKDVFLKAKMAESAEGFIPLSVLLTFNRVNAVTKDAKVLAESIKASTLLVVDEENLQVRRAQPLPESIQTDAEC